MKKINITRIVVILFILVLFAILPGPSYNVGASTPTNQYIVKTGDSLYVIAGKYNISINALKQANALTSDMIIPEQVLKIPAAVSNPNLYTVVYGDTLYKISQKCNTTISELKWANSLGSDMIMPGRVLKIPADQNKALKDIIYEKGVNIQNGGIEIRVDKTNHVLGVFNNGTLLKSYHTELGDNGLEDKEISGDHKTPEGTFYITEKSVIDPADQYLGSRWMRLSYPNVEDANRGLKNGLIDNSIYNDIVNSINNLKTPPQRTSLGGGVGIHGGSAPELGSDWTWGCVGLTNNAVEDFYDYVTVGTKVIIQR